MMKLPLPSVVCDFPAALAMIDRDSDAEKCETNYRNESMQDNCICNYDLRLVRVGICNFYLNMKKKHVGEKNQ